MIFSFMREHPFFCTSAGACVTGFMPWSMPYLQFAALLVSVIAGVISIVRNIRRK